MNYVYNEDGLWEILFLTLRDYPIKAIVSAIQRTRDTIWYVYEEMFVDDSVCRLKFRQA